MSLERKKIICFKNDEGYKIHLDDTTLALEWDDYGDPKITADVYFYHPTGRLVQNPRNFEGRWANLANEVNDCVMDAAYGMGYPASEPIRLDTWFYHKSGRWTLLWNNRVPMAEEDHERLF